MDRHNMTKVGMIRRIRQENLVFQCGKREFSSTKQASTRSGISILQCALATREQLKVLMALKAKSAQQK